MVSVGEFQDISAPCTASYVQEECEVDYHSYCWFGGGRHYHRAYHIE